jgi:hypothetical protein
MPDIVLIQKYLEIPYATKGVMGSSDIYYNTTELLGYDSQYSISEFKFNTSWDWIMPVVEKLHYEGVEFTINDWGTLSNVKNILTYNFTLNKNRKGKHCYKTLLDATYQNVVNAIKLLNKFNTIELLNK